MTSGSKYDNIRRLLEDVKQTIREINQNSGSLYDVKQTDYDYKRAADYYVLSQAGLGFLWRLFPPGSIEVLYSDGAGIGGLNQKLVVALPGPFPSNPEIRRFLSQFLCRIATLKINELLAVFLTSGYEMDNWRVITPTMGSYIDRQIMEFLSYYKGRDGTRMFLGPKTNVEEVNELFSRKEYVEAFSLYRGILPNISVVNLIGKIREGSNVYFATVPYPTPRRIIVEPPTNITTI